jgi:prepilin signal peptidase PulO-like enzyme (type II secretory pathway)
LSEAASGSMPILILLFECLGAVLAGVLLGNGGVYFFNKMPGKWFVNDGEEPDEELLHPTEQRVKSYPWKYIFTMLFVCAGIWLVWSQDWRFALAADLALWFLLEMAIADIKYRIVPDPLVILLAVSAVGFINYQFSWRDNLFGALTGFGVMMVVALLGRLFYRRAVIGGGDVKLFAALGLVCGVSGVLIVMALTALISAAHFVYLLARKRIKKTDSMPMVPYIAVSAAVYLLFLYGNDLKFLI